MSSHAFPATGSLAAEAAGGHAPATLLGPRLALYSLVGLACVAGSAAGWEQSRALLPLAFAAVAIAIWHGAYDPLQARATLAPRLGARWLPAFLAGYLALAALTLAGWWLFPFASLVLFLGYSAWHFGSEGQGTTPRPLSALAAFALGAMPIAAACRWNPAQVVPILAQMLHRLPAGTAQAAALTLWLGRLFWPAVACIVLAAGIGCFGKGALRRLAPLAVTGLTATLFLLCNPLLAFAAYFCFWHTPAHLVATSRPRAFDETLPANLYRNLRAGLLPWLLSLAALALVFAFGQHAVASYQAELFIVLSALTVPHMALNELDHLPRLSPRRSISDRERTP